MSNSRGYICIALNSSGIDYLRMAYCLALSLRVTQSFVSNLTVVVEDPADVPARLARVFDHVTALPLYDLSRGSRWRVQNYNQLYLASPYEETVTLDADMLFFDDVSNWWPVMATRNVLAATHVLDHRGKVVVNNPLRKSFYRVGLPDVHNGFLFFRKSEEAMRLFDEMRRITRDWEAVSRQIFGTVEHYSGDAAMVCALRTLGMEREVTTGDTAGIPNFVHMKTGIQGWVGASDPDWRRYGEVQWRDLRLFIGGHEIRAPLHYHVRDFITDDVLARYEAAYAAYNNCFGSL
jgi:hypothetical protein